MKEYLNKKELGEVLGVSMGKVESMMNSGLKYVKFGRNVRFDKVDIVKYLEERKK